MKNLRKFLTGALMLGMISVTAARSEAVPINLSDQNSFVAIDPDSQQGMAAWVVDNGTFATNHAFQQWFWYRIGEGASGQEASIDTLSASTVTTANNDLDPGDEYAKVTYNNAAGSGLVVEVKYTLVGSGPGSDSSHIDEVITLKNFGHGLMHLHFFQYSDFDLDGSAGDIFNPPLQSGHMSSNQATQTDGVYGLVENVDGTPLHEIGGWPGIFNKLEDGSATTLNGNSNYTGDVTWAFQWDLNIASENSYTINAGHTVGLGVPEPASLVLFGMSLIGVAGVARRRKALVVPQV